MNVVIMLTLINFDINPTTEDNLATDYVYTRNRTKILDQTRSRLWSNTFAPIASPQSHKILICPLSGQGLRRMVPSLSLWGTGCSGGF